MELLAVFPVVHNWSESSVVFIRPYCVRCLLVVTLVFSGTWHWQIRVFVSVVYVKRV